MAHTVYMHAMKQVAYNYVCWYVYDERHIDQDRFYKTSQKQKS